MQQQEQLPALSTTLPVVRVQKTGTSEVELMNVSYNTEVLLKTVPEYSHKRLFTFYILIVGIFTLLYLLYLLFGPRLSEGINIFVQFLFFGVNVPIIIYFLTNIEDNQKLERKIMIVLDKLISYNDIRTIGLVTHIAYFITYIFRSQKKQKPIFQALQILLESLTKSDLFYFTEIQEKALQQLAQNKRIHREYPDLAQAIIVALYILHTPTDKVILEKIAKSKPTNKSEEWVTEAALLCLREWDN